MNKWVYILVVACFVIAMNSPAFSFTIDGADELTTLIKNTPASQLHQLKGKSIILTLIDDMGSKYNWVKIIPTDAFEIVETNRNTFKVTIVNPESLIVTIGGLEQRKDIIVYHSLPIGELLGGISGCTFPLEFRQLKGEKLVFNDVKDIWQPDFEYNENILELILDYKNNLVTFKRREGQEKTTANVKLILKDKKRNVIQESKTIMIPQCSDKNEDSIMVQRKPGHCVIKGGGTTSIGPTIEGDQMFINTCPRDVKCEFDIQYYVKGDNNNKTNINRIRHFIGLKSNSGEVIKHKYTFPYNYQDGYDLGKSEHPFTNTVAEDLGLEKVLGFSCQWASSSDVKKEALADEYIFWAGLYEEKENRKKALDYYIKALKEGPDDYAHAYNALAWFYVSCPDPNYRNGKEAIKLAIRALSLDRSYLNLDTLACAYAEIGNFAKAIEIEKEAYKLKPRQYYADMIEAFKKGKTYVQYKYN